MPLLIYLRPPRPRSRIFSSRRRDHDPLQLFRSSSAAATGAQPHAAAVAVGIGEVRAPAAAVVVPEVVLQDPAPPSASRTPSRLAASPLAGARAPNVDVGDSFSPGSGGLSAVVVSPECVRRAVSVFDDDDDDDDDDDSVPTPLARARRVQQHPSTYSPFRASSSAAAVAAAPAGISSLAAAALSAASEPEDGDDSESSYSASIRDSSSSSSSDADESPITSDSGEDDDAESEADDTDVSSDGCSDDGSVARKARAPYSKAFSLHAVRDLDTVEEVVDLLHAQQSSGCGPCVDDFAAVIGKDAAGLRGTCVLTSASASVSASVSSSSIGVPVYRGPGEGSSELVRECIFMHLGRHLLMYTGEHYRCTCRHTVRLSYIVCTPPVACTDSACARLTCAGKISPVQLAMLRNAYEHVTSTAMITSVCDIVRYVRVCHACYHMCTCETLYAYGTTYDGWFYLQVISAC